MKPLFFVFMAAGLLPAPAAMAVLPCSEILEWIGTDIIVARNLRDEVREDPDKEDSFVRGEGLTRTQNQLAATYLTDTVRRQFSLPDFSELVETLQALQKIGQDIQAIRAGTQRQEITTVEALYNSRSNESRLFANPDACYRATQRAMAKIKADDRVPEIYRTVLENYPNPPPEKPIEAYFDLAASLDILFCEGQHLFGRE